MPRCSSENKFTALEFQDPKVEDIDIDDNGQVTCTVNLVRAREGCGDESKTATLEMDDDLQTDLAPHLEDAPPPEAFGSTIQEALDKHGEDFLIEVGDYDEDARKEILDESGGGPKEWVEALKVGADYNVYEAACRILGKEPEDFPEHELSVESTDCLSIEEGGGRYKKSYFGAAVQYEVTCTCTGEVVHTGEMDGKVAASEMEGEDSH